MGFYVAYPFVCYYEHVFMMQVYLALFVMDSAHASCSGGLSGETLVECRKDEGKMLREAHIQIAEAKGRKVFIETNGKRTTVTKYKLKYEANNDACVLTKKSGQSRTFYEDGKLRSVENCAEVTRIGSYAQSRPYKQIVRHSDYVFYHSDGKTKSVQGKSWCGYNLQRSSWDEKGKPILTQPKENPVTAQMRASCVVK